MQTYGSSCHLKSPLPLASRLQPVVRGPCRPAAATSFYFLNWSWKSSFSCEISSFLNLGHMFKRKKFRPNRAHLGTVHGSCSPCSSVSQPRPLPGYLVVRNQASGTPPLQEVLRLSAILFRAFFQSGNMGIICFDQYFHMLNTTVIEKPLRHQARTRVLQHIVKRRGESLYREISK